MVPSRPPAGSARPKAVLFDSGGVLMQPIGGRWNPRADFEPTVLKRDPAISATRLAEAFAVGERFMFAAASTPDYTEYHAVMLEDLGVTPTPELLAELIKPVPAHVVLELSRSSSRRTSACSLMTLRNWWQRRSTSGIRAGGCGGGARRRRLRTCGTSRPSAHSVS